MRQILLVTWEIWVCAINESRNQNETLFKKFIRNLEMRLPLSSQPDK